MPQPRRLNIKRQNKRYYRHVVYPQIKISEGDIYITSGVNQILDLLVFINDYILDKSKIKKKRKKSKRKRKRKKKKGD